MVKFETFSNKQAKVLTWWMEGSPYKDYDAIIADGSIRSGKTVSMAISFFIWSMSTFQHQNLIVSSKTVSSFDRNIMFWLQEFLTKRGYSCEYRRAESLIIVRKGNVENYYRVFGGRDARSYEPLQGLTAAGALFDEVALMPESFVNQAIARCSVEGSKYWFNCNPDKPMHWMKTEIIDNAKERNYYYLHFTMDDNPGLSDKVKERLRNSFSGIFYDRYIRGKWVLAEDIIYSMFGEENIYDEDLSNDKKIKCTRYIAIDYGITNPMAIYDIYDDGKISYIENEYYYDSKKHMHQKTDDEYMKDLQAFIDQSKVPVRRIVIDPSATSFKVLLHRKGYIPKDADNEVLEGIKYTSTAWYTKILKVNRKCSNLLDEINGYSWDAKAALRGVEQPVKMEDHAMDAIRYYVNSILKIRLKYLSN